MTEFGLDNPTPQPVSPGNVSVQPEFPAALPPAVQGPTSANSSNAAFDRTTGAVQEIERDLGTRGTEQLDDHVRDEIFQSLNNLRKTSSNFDQDLLMVNARLQHDGYLPNLFIVDNEPGKPIDPSKLIGPNSKDGFHIDSTVETPAPTGGEVDFSPPQHDAAPGESQPEWHGSHPGNPAGTTGGDYNQGGSTPIGDGAVESSPVNQGTLGTPELMSQVEQALQLLNAQRAAQGLPPIEATPDNMQAILQIIQHESGGNPNAQNNSDSNAAKGDPSRGLMQTIGSTFSSYHVQGTSNNIFDPVANIAAGVNYAVSRYGSLQEVPGVKATASGGSYVGY